VTLIGPLTVGLRSEMLLDMGAFRRDDGTAAEGKRLGALELVVLEDLDDWSVVYRKTNHNATGE